MLDFIRNLDTISFVVLLVLLVSGIMILLQAAVRRAVWNVYLVIFFGSLGAFLTLLRQ